MNKLKQALQVLAAKWSKLGSAEVLTWEEYVEREHDQVSQSYAQFLESRCIHFHPAPKCIMVGYDFCDDEVDGDEKEEFLTDLDSFYAALRELGESLYDEDGSGNGLYYGLSLYNPQSGKGE